MMTFKFKRRTKKKDQETRVRYDLEKLRDPILKEACQKAPRGRFAPLMLINNLQELNNEFTTIINETVKNVLGKARESRRPWITTKVQEKCYIRWETKKERFKDDEDLQKYREVNKETKMERTSLTDLARSNFPKWWYPLILKSAFSTCRFKGIIFQNGCVDPVSLSLFWSARYPLGHFVVTYVSDNYLVTNNATWEMKNRNRLSSSSLRSFYFLFYDSI